MTDQLAETASHKTLLSGIAFLGLVLILSAVCWTDHIITSVSWLRDALQWHFSDLTHWQCWELVAVCWSLLFGAYYYFTFPFTKKDSTDRLMAGLLPLFTLALCLTAIRFLFWRPSGSGHFYCVLAIGSFFGVADWILWSRHTDRQHKKTFKESLFVADAPMLIGLIFLGLYQLIHRAHTTAPGESMDAFLGGAISFQLIVSNVVFVFSQGGVFRKIWQEPKPAQSNPGAPAPEHQSNAT
jgi:hypothetical protein